MTSPAQIDWPTGGFQWTNQLRAQLPIVRGIHVPDFRAPDDPLANPPVFSDETPTRSELKAFFQGHWLDENAFWTAAEAAEYFKPATLLSADAEVWGNLLLQSAARAFCRGREKIEWGTILWATAATIALNSPAFATRLFLDLNRALTHHYLDAYKQEHYKYLRWVLAAAPEEQYQAAWRETGQFNGRSEKIDTLISFLFPDNRAWADRCATTSKGHEGASWLSYSSLSVEAFQKHYQHNANYYGHFGMDRAAYLLQIQLHGEAAWPLLEDLTGDKLSLATRMWMPALIPAMLERCERHSDVRNALEKLAAKWPAAVLKSVMDKALVKRSGVFEALAGSIAAQQPAGLETVLAVASEAERQRYLRAFSFLAPPPEDAPDEMIPATLRQPPQVDGARPKLPGFFLPGNFHRPRLPNGQALPLSALENLGHLLAASTLEKPRPELAEVKAACTPESLAEFAWDLFEAWQAAGNSTKAIWGYFSLGLLGDGSTARRLVPKMAEWRKQQIHLRANLGIEILAAIGNDAALMQLHGIIHKPQFKNLRDKAQAKIDGIAAARGLSLDELADRMVPDLGLDERGGLDLDFGPRRFRAGFDEALNPVVCNAEGVRLKDLPKPNKSDDETKAPAAVARYKQLKKDAKAVAALQIARFEHSMCALRRWPVDEFQALILKHPLLCHLARRLVWGVYRDGALADAFRVAEDVSLAGRTDEVFTLPEGGLVGIIHPLNMPEDLTCDFAQIFGDYKIVQPFRQLGRETYSLTDAERQAGKFTRFGGRKVSSGGIMGLTGRGWEWGSREHYPYVDSLRKRLPGGLHGELWISPGVNPTDARADPVQEIEGVEVRRYQEGDFRFERIDLSSLDPVLVSEIIRDVDLIGSIPG